MRRFRTSLRSIASDESGLSKLEWLGVVALVASLLSLIGPVREIVINMIGVVFGQVDETTGEITDFSQAMRGFAIVGGAIAVFVGSGWLLLWTNVGRRLAFLLIGAGTFGWLTINSIFFIVYAPRGIRPANLEGLNALQMRLPAIAMALASFVLFLMFTVALTRYEREAEEA